MKVIRLAIQTSALAALATSTAVLSQDSGPQDLLSQTQPEVAEEATATEAQPASVQEAFEGTVFAKSAEIVQKTYPLTGEWSLDQAEELASFIAAIGAEGLDPADYGLESLRTAITAGEGEVLNALASRAFVWLVEDLRDGRTPMEARKQWFVVDPDADRMPTGKLLAETLAGGDITANLNALSPVHPDYAKLKEALAQTDDPARTKLIRANMDRWRWLARDLGSKYLLTNVPEFQLRLTVNEKIIRSYKTVVGKPGRNATPQLAEIVEGVVFNPTWTVPQSIVKGEGLGNKVLNNPAWAKRNGYKATKGTNGWITVVQQPGPTNSLGLMKLHMPNRHAIFLHDTPSRHLFKNANRALSHGCIRVEGARTLAMTMAMLGNMETKDDIPAIQKEVEQITGSGKYTLYDIKNNWPVYITYFTMAQDIDGELKTFKDIYGRDAPVLAALDKPRQIERLRETQEEVIVIEADPRAG
ncbi:L,D-transpeptidase family protein [Erythrobacter sp. W53]|uniref:L,D-transpeptidase family protein n=1 Tax=Erythrobacter sp. W53 TaxID=3425947 RepID=UPI003D769617